MTITGTARGPAEATTVLDAHRADRRPDTMRSAADAQREDRGVSADGGPGRRST